MRALIRERVLHTKMTENSSNQLPCSYSGKLQLLIRHDSNRIYCVSSKYLFCIVIHLRRRHRQEVSDVRHQSIYPHADSTCIAITLQALAW